MSKKSLEKTAKQAQKKIDKANKHITKEEKKTAEVMAEVYIAFQGMGSECGVEIAKVARELHPDALFIFPLYRGCIVIPKQEYTGTLDVILYHDPHWMGHDEITTENLPKFQNVLKIYGQRSGQDYELNGEELIPEDFAIWKFLNSIEMKAGWDYVKKKDPKAHSMFLGDVPKPELYKRMDEIFWRHAEKQLHIPTKESEKRLGIKRRQKNGKGNRGKDRKD